LVSNAGSEKNTFKKRFFPSGHFIPLTINLAGASKLLSYVKNRSFSASKRFPANPETIFEDQDFIFSVKLSKFREKSAFPVSRKQTPINGKSIMKRCNLAIVTIRECNLLRSIDRLL
jgi:hypothetical protein